jgi:hypothetical protein
MSLDTIGDHRQCMLIIDTTQGEIFLTWYSNIISYLRSKVKRSPFFVLYTHFVLRLKSHDTYE